MNLSRPEDVLVPYSRSIWGLVFLLCMYALFCWGIYTIAVAPGYGALSPPTIEADSSTYYQAAGLSGNSDDFGSDNLLAFGGSSLGPALVALMCRTTLGVAIFNSVLFLITIWWAGFVPGVNRAYFAAFMAVEPQLVPTLVTLNKEMLVLAGLVSFAAYLYSGQAKGRRRGSLWLLFWSLVLSILGRWQQLIILLWYLGVNARWSPLRYRPKTAIASLLLFLSVSWFAAIKLLHLNLGGFVSAVSGGGTVARLYAIQEKGGYFLVALPKIIMYIAGRWVTPKYFFTDYWGEDFNGSWQNQYVGILSSLCMLIVLAVVILKGRFRLDRPLMHLTLIYFICTAVNPFIQPRYIYPAYVLLALEMSRREDALEPVKPFWKPPRLPASYLQVQSEAE